MEKIKINLQNETEKVIKFKGEKITIKTYLEIADVVKITSICLQQFFPKDADADYSRLTLATSLFDILVTECCSNIKIDGIKHSTKGKEAKLVVSLTEEQMNEILASGITKIVNSNIINYTESKEQLLKSIELWNLNLSVLKVANAVPSLEDMKNSTSALTKEIKDIKENHADTFSKIVSKSKK